MDRHFAKTDDPEHDAAEFRMQSVGERDEWAKVFPLELPSTHRLEYSWHPTRGAAPVNDASAMVLRLRVVPKDVEEPANLPPSLEAHRAAVRKELEKLSKADLITRAAELGVTLTDTQTKPVMVAALLEKLVTVPASA